jgi:putative copper export protein
VTPLYELAAIEWPLLVALLGLFGTSLFCIAIAAPEGASAEATARWLAPLWLWLSVAALLLLPLGLAVDAAGMTGDTLRASLPMVPEVMFGTHAGRLWMWRFPLAVAILAAALAARRHRRASMALCALSAGALLAQSLGSHAIDKGTAAVAVYFVHELAAGAWFGALGGLILAVAGGGASSEWVTAATPRVSRIATWSVAILAASGLFTAYGELGLDPGLLIYSLYGRTLLYKLITVGVVLALGAYNRYRLMPAMTDAPVQASLLRNVAAETILLAAVLGWTALLANSPPPH